MRSDFLTVEIFDPRQCILGEGPLWHPIRQQLFWFDIMNSKLLSRDGGVGLDWQFDRHVSAAGWIDRDRLLIASERGLSEFNLATGRDTVICEIEADNPDTRSNDGRADPWGGFWMGTMGKAGEPGAGALYRWFNGELRCLERGLTTPNAICFDKGRRLAYYADTRQRLVWRRELDPDTGWPRADADVFLDLSAAPGRAERKPDGAIVDQEGCFWVAQWGSARVARHDPSGHFLSAIDLPTGHASCPAFGGPDLSTLFVTTATQKLADVEAWRADAGKTFCIETAYSGVAEPAVAEPLRARSR